MNLLKGLISVHLLTEINVLICNQIYLPKVYLDMSLHGLPVGQSSHALVCHTRHSVITTQYFLNLHFIYAFSQKDLVTEG